MIFVLIVFSLQSIANRIRTKTYTNTNQKQIISVLTIINNQRRMNMNTTTTTQIDNSVEVIEQFAIELDLDTVLAEELEDGYSSDINSCY